MCRRFVLDRYEDHSGVSGVGTVAQGIIFGDGTVVLRWCASGHRSTAMYDSIEDLEAIHGHGGSTRVRYMDKECAEI